MGCMLLHLSGAILGPKNGSERQAIGGLLLQSSDSIGGTCTERILLPEEGMPSGHLASEAVMRGQD